MLGVASLVSIAMPQSASAAPIAFELTDLADTVVGEDLWEYVYTLNGDPVGQDLGFAIFFDETLYASLSAPSAPAGWDVLLFQPDPALNSAGLFDALALVNAPALGPFSVEFVWIGGAAGPSAQPYELYRFEGDEYIRLDGSETVAADAVTPVPEPASMALLATGIAGVLAAHRRKRATARSDTSEPSTT